VRYLGIEVGDALTIAEQLELWLSMAAVPPCAAATTRAPWPDLPRPRPFDHGCHERLESAKGVADIKPRIWRMSV